MDPTIGELMEDARIVAAHGARAGAFAADETLFAALAAAEAKGAALAYSDREFAAVQAAMSKAMPAIRPVTLRDLKEGWRIDREPVTSRWTRFRRNATMTAVLCATILTLIACASLTIWQRKAEAIVTELKADKARLLSVAVNELFPLIETLDDEDVQKLLDPSSGIRLALRQKGREIRALETQLLADLKEYERLWARRPLILAGDVFKNLGSLWTPAASDATPRGARERAGGPAAAPEAGLQYALGESEDASCFDAGQFDTAVESSGAGSRSNLAIYNSLLDNDRAHFKNLGCKLKLEALPLLVGFERPEGRQARLFADTREMAHRLDVLGVWLLPALYGMLGALIYHLRVYLNNLRPDPSLVKVVLRVCLGGFAGVAIGWFWMPDSGALGVTDITLGALALAFLVGFSIDVFLSLLDRLVMLLSNWINGLGGQQPAG